MKRSRSMNRALERRITRCLFRARRLGYTDEQVVEALREGSAEQRALADILENRVIPAYKIARAGLHA